ncbi:MAG: hypothetical protein PF501_10930 [Salinisphaera sp.]|jgi:hypothetical protein|nr:hypothetical protein [Salinisphaera sp.]
MAQIPYTDTQAQAARLLGKRMAAERASVLHLYQMLLQSPPVAEGWLGFMTSIRQCIGPADETREFVTTSAGYNMVSRFLAVLGVQSSDKKEPQRC